LTLLVRESSMQGTPGGLVRGRRLVVPVFLTCLCAMLASAQTPVPVVMPDADYRVTGHVFGLGGDPISGAEVAVIEPGSLSSRRVQTDTSGAFTVGGITHATVSLRVRAFGYTPKTTAVTAPSTTHVASVTVSLEPLAAELASMPITEGSPDYDSKLADYYARKAANSFAHFIDGTEIIKRKPPFVSEVLRSIPGVVLTGTGRIGNVVRIRGCSPLVWVDGIRMPGAQLDEVAAPADVAGIEIYNSFAGIPARYFDRTATCGTILVWLRS
jgi:hypothetical protein